MAVATPDRSRNPPVNLDVSLPGVLVLVLVLVETNANIMHWLPLGAARQRPICGAWQRLWAAREIVRGFPSHVRGQCRAW